MEALQYLNAGRSSGFDAILLTKGVEEVLLVVASIGYPSPFSMLERRMDLLGSPSNTSWVTLKGPPLQACSGRLIGDYLGRTVEVNDVRYHVPT